MKIIIIGYSGSGKTTLATKLGEMYGCVVFHVDDIMYDANGNQCKAEDAMRAMESCMAMSQEDGWIIDGYRWQCIKEEWIAETDHIIFLNIGKWTCFWGVLVRYAKGYAHGTIKRIKRYRTQEEHGKTWDNVKFPHKNGDKIVERGMQRRSSFIGESFRHICDEIKRMIRHLCYIIRVEHIHENEYYYIEIGEHYPEKFIVLRSRRAVKRFLGISVH